MKKLFLYFTLLMTCGCQALSQASQQSIQTSTGCLEKPKTTLSKDNVEEISLSEQTVSKSGKASADKSIGYTFEAEAGQQLSYRTSDDICIWIYTQDNKLLNSGKLTQTGKYTLQVSAPKGSTTFNLEMSLDTLQASSSSTPTSTTANLSSSTQADITAVEPAPEKPAADEFVRDYYLGINNRQYGDTWSKLSLDFQSISSSYSDYTQWWDSVKEVEIGDITLVNQSSDVAVVDAELWYIMNNGKVVKDSTNRIYLMWSDEDNGWLLNRKSAS